MKTAKFGENTLAFNDENLWEATDQADDPHLIILLNGMVERAKDLYGPAQGTFREYLFNESMRLVGGHSDVIDDEPGGDALPDEVY